MNKVWILAAALSGFLGWGLGRGHEREVHAEMARSTPEFKHFQGCLDDIVSGRIDRLPIDHDRALRLTEMKP